MSQGGTLRRSKSKSGLSLRLSFSRSPKSPLPETKDDSGTNGFHELRKYIKQSAEFAKELTAILQERSELEANYAKGLSKISGRLAKVSKDAVGELSVYTPAGLSRQRWNKIKQNKLRPRFLYFKSTGKKKAAVCDSTLANAWIGVAMEMEQEAELHRSVADFVAQEVAQPLRTLNDTHTKSRKQIEAVVERSDKTLTECRTNEFKVKRNSFTLAKELENLQEKIHGVKLGKVKSSSEKEVGKLQAKRHKLADAVRLEEKEYHDCCIQSERARQDWDNVMYKSANLLQTVEEERRKFLQETGVKYVNLMASVAPKYTIICDKMRDHMSRVDLNLDIQSIISERGTSPNIQEQILCDFYAEDRANVMNKDRRVEALHKYILLFTEDIQKELKSREGIGHLAQVYRETPNFVNDEGQMNVTEKLQQSESMLRFLQANSHKICVALADVEGLEKPRHALQRFMERERDKNNLPMTVLKIPEWVARDLKPDENGNIISTAPPGSPLHQNLTGDRGSRASSSGSGSVGRNEGKRILKAADDQRQSVIVQSHIYPSTTTASFDTVDHGSLPEAPPPYSEACKGRCRAIYEYTARMPDELTIYPGDSIFIHAKQSDGWWRGELRGKTGTFPACYVQEI